MIDQLTREERSRNMAAIKAAGTSLEIYVRRIIFSEGLRFRINQKNLPGKPDIVLAKYKAAIYVHGCFWHRHQCHLAATPKSNSGYWINKFNSNVARDRKNIQSLQDLDWKVIIIWECALRGKSKLDESIFRLRLLSGIKDNSTKLIEIAGSSLPIESTLSPV